MLFLTTFPRSGHHFLVETTAAVFPDLSYCEKYRCENQWHEKISCAGRHLPMQCKTFCRSGKKIQKSHDFGLDEPIFNGKIEGEDVRTLVLVRHPVPAIISWWKLTLVSSNMLDSQENFRDFFKQKVLFYKGFVSKWVSKNNFLTDASVQSVAYMSYERMTRDPEALSQSVKFLLPRAAHRMVDLKADYLRSSIDVQAKDLTRFKYFDEGFFHENISDWDLSYLMVGEPEKEMFGSNVSAINESGSLSEVA